MAANFKNPSFAHAHTLPASRPSLESQTFAPKMEAMMMKCRWVGSLPIF